GRSAPNLELVDGTKQGEHFEDGRGLLMDFDVRAPLRALASRWRGRIIYIVSDARDPLGLSALLVRPDGFVAWASDTAPDLVDAAQALSRWFRQPE
ncbi:MAG: FAD-dependent oxidoreductase, partial [Hyphomicrobium sp.]|nr:FAD-dependent oxidoreductase [Hyphomicrobium sp.]